MEMKTDFEKLVVARKYIAALEQENKLLKKEVVTQFEAAKAAENALEKERNFREKMSPAEKRKIKADIYVQELKNTINALQAKLKVDRRRRDVLCSETINDLKAKLEAAINQNSKLVYQLIRMKAELQNHRLPGSLMTKLKRLFQKNKNGLAEP